MLLDEAPPVPLDGRRERGLASRRAILDAASQVIIRDGVGALTHRSVAEAAGVPLARVSYHYPRIDDLLVAAATRYLDGFDRRLGALALTALDGRRSLVEACTDFLHELVTTGAAEFLAMVEVRLALHRRGREVDGDAVLGVVGSLGVERSVAESIVAGMFGFAVLAAASADPIDRAHVRSHVATVLGVAR